MAEEGGHWYDPRNGTLVKAVPYSNCKVGSRLPTIRDARTLGLYPSVTTILSILDKPGLRSWWNGQLVRAVSTTPRLADDSDDEWVAACINEASVYAEWAADYGTDVHYGISRHLQGQTFDTLGADRLETVTEFLKWFKSSGLVTVATERQFISPAGFAGTADWIGTYLGKPTLVDFKTQNFEVYKNANFYDEYALQLAGYADGLGLTDHQRISVVISRTVPGLVNLKVWKENQRWTLAWRSLWETWKALKNFDPTKVSPEEQQ